MGFHSHGGTPWLWTVYKENTYLNGWFGGTPILGNPHSGFGMGWAPEHTSSPLPSQEWQCRVCCCEAFDFFGIRRCRLRCVSRFRAFGLSSAAVGACSWLWSAVVVGVCLLALARLAVSFVLCFGGSALSALFLFLLAAAVDAGRCCWRSSFGGFSPPWGVFLWVVVVGVVSCALFEQYHSFDMFWQQIVTLKRISQA